MGDVVVEDEQEKRGVVDDRCSGLGKVDETDLYELGLEVEDDASTVFGWCLLSESSVIIPVDFSAAVAM